jgi:hypothetical protein
MQSSVTLSDFFDFVFLFNGVGIGGALFGVHNFVSQALRNSFVLFDGGVSGTNTHIV